MSTAAQIADLVTQGITPPSGPNDSAYYTGTVLTWDESSQTNTVQVNGVVLSNLKSVQGGIGVLYGNGDTVLIVRKQTQYFVLGKISAPGAAAPNQIRYAEVTPIETTSSTSYTTLATPGPNLSNVLIGSSRRILLIANVFVQALNLSATLPSQNIGGTMSFDITGASNLPTVGTVEGTWIIPTNGFGGGTGHYTRTWVMTAANGINQGLHTFTAKYKSASGSVAAGFATRNITVIPF